MFYKMIENKCKEWYDSEQCTVHNLIDYIESYNPKSIVARILSIWGGIVIMAAIIVSVRITFPATSLFDYIIMVILMASGAGMLLKAFFNKNK